MAAHGPSTGMLNHVRKQNATEVKRQPSKENIKMKLKVPLPSKTKASANTPVAQDLRNRSQRTASHGEDEVNRAPSLFGTNASNIDESSPDDHAERHHLANYHQPIRDDQSEQYEGDGEDFSEQDDAEVYDHREQDGQNDSVQAQGPARGFAQMHLKEDSYPETSQFTDERQLIDDRANTHATYHNTDQMILPHQASGTRVAPHQSKELPVEWSQQQQQPTSQLQEQRTIAVQGGVRTNTNDVVEDINNGFSFALVKRDRQHVPTQPPAPAPAPDNANLPKEVQPELMGAPIYAPVQDVRQHPRMESPRSNTPIRGKQVDYEPKNRRKSGQNAPAMHVHPGHERQLLNSTVISGKPQMRQLPVQHPVQREEAPREPEREPDPGPDYDPPALYQMDYARLKGESFDIDPSATEFRFPDDEPTNDLPQKLECVAKLIPPNQAEFFLSLDIDAWEEAGDWFLQRFGDLIKRLKETRREKRKAVEVLEDEIQDRHNAVSKKQKMTLAAMGEMKESGVKVLQATPKKTRKSK